MHLFALAVVAYWLGVFVRSLLVRIRPALTRLELGRNQPKVPELYPGIDGDRFDVVLDAEAIARMTALPIIEFGPLHGDDERSRRVGVALSRVLIRELQRAPGLSVRGPEDTPVAALAGPEAAQGRVGSRQCVLGGAVRVSGERCQAQLWLSQSDGRVERAELDTDSAEALVFACGVRVLDWFGVARGPAFSSAAQVSWPGNADGFARLGAVIEFAARHGDEPFDVDDEVLALLREGAQMSVAGVLLSNRHCAAKLELLAAYPDDAQLCFAIGMDLWSGYSGDRAAFQFLRRALEISPGLGKAHMMAPALVVRPERMGAHAELGYQLQPNNTFGASNYLSWLARFARNPERAKQVALAEVARAPADPQNYYHLIDAYEASGDARRALETAQQLLRYLAPLHPRTRECFEHDQKMRKRPENADWDPAAELRARIKKIEGELKPREAVARTA